MAELHEGLTVSAPLFFNSDESIDYLTLEKYLTDVCQNRRISAVYSMAYNTRYRMLNDEEVLNVNKFITALVKAHGHRVYVGHPYIFSRKSLTSYLEEISAEKPDGISMLYPERYYGINDPIIDFLKIPQKFNLDVVLHEMKLVSGFDGQLINWPENLLEDVFKKINLVAVKEDSKSNQVTDLVLDLCKKYGVHCVLAGGGKIRAQEFVRKGMSTWLNGSTMFLPQLIDQTYQAFIEDDSDYKSWYLKNIELPFFNDVVAKTGWHLAHKAALEYFGYGVRAERFPHPAISEDKYEELIPTFDLISKAVAEKFKNCSDYSMASQMP